MNALFAAAADIQTFCISRGWRSSVIGGVAVFLKAFAGRPQDWIDVEGVIVRQGPALDRRLVLVEARPLLDLKDDTAAEPRLLELFKKHPE